MNKIDTVPLGVELKTITLNGKKLTKSIFNQIEFKDCFDHNMDFIGDGLFGYIKDKNQRYLIWSYAGKLKKTNLTDYSKLYELRDTHTSTDIIWFLKKGAIHFDDYDNGGSFRIDFDNVTLEKYNMLVTKVKAFISDILNQQLFI